LTWRLRFNQAVEEDKAWFLYHGQHPGETEWQREIRLAKYCRAMAKADWGKPSNYWDREAAAHEAKADGLVAG
jgi:hypothetical protein